MAARIGIIGLGMIGRDHLHRFEKVIVNAKVTAVCDINPAVANSVAQDHHATPYTDAASMIQSSEVDAIFICSIGEAHKDAILVAMEVGKPIFCEKPLAPTAEEAQEVIDLELKHGSRILQLGFMRRFDPGYLALKQTIDSGALGEIVLMHCAHRNAVMPGHFTQEKIINDSATHEIDMIRFLLNENIVSVRVDKPRKKTHRAPAGMQDPLIAIFETESGIRVDDTLYVNCNYGYDIRCEVLGEDSTAELNEQALISTRTKAGSSARIAETCMERFATAYDREVQNFVDNVYNERPMTGPSSWDGFVVAVVCDAALKSLRDGERHDVILPRTPELYR
ncbi:hypothetical protein DOTSEDRAFT_52820 [Dothistroma septosporum NZE10]|uniref:Inositol 2-dehydrogenase n=1 Tax=Dothistroma septosporum (strain NZE10 / CBS 128990) TaxID=675120 RepID=N1PQ74_DOTSN|nr:hypothetical protein DOTSEDRAFT_52820 [Dothistroma septosporum NZE10]